MHVPQTPPINFCFCMLFHNCHVTAQEYYSDYTATFWNHGFRMCIDFCRFLKYLPYSQLICPPYILQFPDYHAFLHQHFFPQSPKTTHLSSAKMPSAPPSSGPNLMIYFYIFLNWMFKRKNFEIEVTERIYSI